jgi:hypothetical protein
MLRQPHGNHAALARFAPIDVEGLLAPEARRRLQARLTGAGVPDLVWPARAL